MKPFRLIRNIQKEITPNVAIGPWKNKQRKIIDLDKDFILQEYYVHTENNRGVENG